MSDLKSIKEEIYNCGFIPKLLEGLGCEHIEMRGERFEAQLPEHFDSSNIRSVQVYNNESLTAAVRSRGIKGDIYTLVAYLLTEKSNEDYLNKHVHLAKKKIIEILQMDQFKGKSKLYDPNNDPNAWLKDIAKRKKKRFSMADVKPNEVYPESVLNQFVKAGHQIFLDDGISLDTQYEFEVGFDLQSERIIFPIRNRQGEIVGVKGRATKPEDVEYAKYLFLYTCNKRQELFNLHRALPHIHKSNQVILAESEKSTMLAHDYGQFNVISQMGSDIDRVQVELLYLINPDLDIVVAYDKDKSAAEVKELTKVFGKRFKKIRGIWDKDNLLHDTESPFDKGKEIWEDLYENYIFPIKL
ncbi:DNA primase [Halobacillus litoralis]|uniref:DNA primase n=1 Tax=Halobacillus litoralis TaxID=45668 RepID=UPI001CD20458|nr:DNA primase [Halobacillus litoralis]MCA1021499.1 DNA primase [Halobacillus litoralis]